MQDTAYTVNKYIFYTVCYQTQTNNAAQAMKWHLKLKFALSNTTIEALYDHAAVSNIL